MGISDFTLGCIADIYEAVERVNISLGGGAGFSESAFQNALAAELGDCQTEVTRAIYHKRKDGCNIAVGTVRFDIVYFNIILEIKVYATKSKAMGIPPQLQAQLRAYKRLLFNHEYLYSVCFYRDGFGITGPC